MWRWAFSGDDTIDTNLATLETAPTITVEASITATQCNNVVTMLSGDGQTYYTLAPSTLSFRSSANIGDFQEVQVNGETIDPSNYTMTEGSTIITLSIDYLKHLKADDYNISIVSNTGSPSAGFSVVEPDLNSHGFYYNQPYTAYVSSLGGEKAFLLREDGTIDVIDVTSGQSETGTFTCEGKTASMNISVGILTGTWSEDGMSIYCNELKVTASLGNESIVADEDYIYIYDSSLGGYVANAINKKKESYGAIKTGINGYQTVKLSEGFLKWGGNITVAPQIPDSVTNIGNYAFFCCENLSSVTIPEGVIFIGNNAFDGCEKLTNITFEGTIEQWNQINLDSSWNQNSAITTIKCSNGTITL